MAVLDTNEIFFTPFEPKQANRFIMYMDGVPSYMVKGVGAVSCQLITSKALSTWSSRGLPSFPTRPQSYTL